MDLLGRTQPKVSARLPNIRVHVTLDQPNVNFNFAALAEDKYGWDALHPVAARLRAINRLDSDEESDSEALAAEGTVGGELGPHNGQAPGDLNGNVTNGTDHAQPAKKRRKRRKDMEYYDITDPFIDDDELVLQERTAASKDGFFVFQGPLVAEGEKVRIEKIDGTQKRAGGGKGSRGGKGARSRPAAAPSRPLGRPPKPVTTKQDTPESEAASPAVSKSGRKPQSTAQSPTSSDSGNEADVMPPPALPVTVNDDPKKQVLGTSDASTSAAATQGNPSTVSLDLTNSSSSTTPPMFAMPSVAAHVEIKTAGAEPGSGAAPSSPKRRASTTLETPKAKVVKKRQPSAAKLAKLADQTPSAQSSSHKAGILSTPGSPQAAGTGSPIGRIPETPTLNPDGSNKKPRKPTREKTVEEKAELARKARESRERKKLEKIAQEQASRAALLARAIANPHIDTTGLSMPVPSVSIPTPPKSEPGEEASKIKNEILAHSESLALPAAHETDALPVIDLPGKYDPVSPNIAKRLEISRVDSPSGRSMSVEALLE